jgi:MOSC domain-containing protein YiiM
MPHVVAVSMGTGKGLAKQPVDVGHLVANVGLDGDRHARGGPRQISLLDASVAEALVAADMPVEPGALGENLLVAGLALDALHPGARLRIGDAVVEISEARTPCRNVRQVDPRALKALVGHAGQMARVVTSGQVRPGDEVTLLEEGPLTGVGRPS